jgi:hypothetical protein
MRILQAILLLALLPATSWASPPPDRPVPPGPPREKERPAVALSDLQFSGATVLAKFRRIDAAAAALAKPEWSIRPYRDSAYSGGPGLFVAEWCQRVDRRGQCDCTLQAARPNHGISLAAQSLKPGKTIDGLSLRTTYLPASGWGVDIEYTTYGGEAALGEMFNLRFHHDKFNPKDSNSNDCALNLVNSYYSTSRRYGDLVYRFQVSTHGTSSWAGDARASRDPLVEKYYSSAKSFRETALAELDSLEKYAREQIPSGKAVISVKDHSNVSSAEPPREVGLSPGGDKSLTKTQTDAILQAALMEIDRRRAIVREHYEEQHAALKAAFPLLECVTEK